jgi:hypothetical protein
MAGRETGHFGSGTYFATYKDSSEVDKLNDVKNMNPNFIQISDHLYRVDLDFYKNLYRVRSKRQGDILYTMMANLNHMFYKITEMGRFVSKNANYDNAGLYQEIKANADALNLDCPSYYQLTRMAQRHEGSQSFSTLFMEWNGYNGVNLSGVDYYDSTLHGSVIYDLSKVNSDMEEVKPRSLYTGFKDSSYNNTIARDVGDEVVDSLQGEYVTWYSRLNGMDISHAMRILKNYTESGHMLNYFIIKDLNDDLKKRYLRFLYIKNPSNDWGDSLIDEEMLNGKLSHRFAEMIDEYGLYYWVNYKSKKKYASMLVNLLSAFELNIPWGAEKNEEDVMKRQYLDKLMSYMERGLTPYEEEYIKEDYFDE